MQVVSLLLVFLSFVMSRFYVLALPLHVTESSVEASMGFVSVNCLFHLVGSNWGQ
jgi:hypothetical protein